MKSNTFKWMLNGIGTAMMLVVAAVAYTLVFWPMDAESQRLRAAISQNRDFLDGAPKINAANRRLKSNLAETERKIAEIKRRVPDRPEEADFLAQLAQAAEDSQIELVDYRPLATVDRESHYELTIRVSASGRYKGICRFLAQLEELPRLCHLTSLKIDAGDLESRVYPVELTLQIFFGPRETDSDDADAA